MTDFPYPKPFWSLLRALIDWADEWVPDPEYDALEAEDEDDDLEGFAAKAVARTEAHVADFRARLAEIRADHDRQMALRDAAWRQALRPPPEGKSS